MIRPIREVVHFANLMSKRIVNDFKVIEIITANSGPAPERVKLLR